MANNTNKQRLLTAADIYSDAEFPLFKNDAERIKYMKKAYGNMSIAKSFAIFYGIEVSQETKQNKSINMVQVIELGKIYSGVVKSFGKNGIVLKSLVLRTKSFQKRISMIVLMQSIITYLITTISCYSKFVNIRITDIL